MMEIFDTPRECQETTCAMQEGQRPPEQTDELGEKKGEILRSLSPPEESDGCKIEEGEIPPSPRPTHTAEDHVHDAQIEERGVLRLTLPPMPQDDTPICRAFNSAKGCSYDIRCKFAHQLMRCAFFSTPGGCDKGDSCRYLHDIDAPASTRTTKECPTVGCTNLCIGKQCANCHKLMRRNKGGCKPRPRVRSPSPASSHMPRHFNTHATRYSHRDEPYSRNRVYRPDRANSRDRTRQSGKEWQGPDKPRSSQRPDKTPRRRDTDNSHRRRRGHSQSPNNQRQMNREHGAN